MDVEKTERNQAIVDLYLSGKSIKELARVFDVSTTLIRQQLDKAGVRKTKTEDSSGQWNPRRWKASVDKFYG